MQQQNPPQNGSEQKHRLQLVFPEASTTNTQAERLELSAPIALRIPVKVLADIENIATASERTRSWVIVRALRLYLAGEGADCLATLRGRNEAAAGGGHHADDVVAELESIDRGKVA